MMRKDSNTRHAGIMVLCLMLVLSSSSVIFSAPLKKSLTLTFTSSKYCFVGFSKKDVTNCVQLSPEERITNPDGSNPVKFPFYPYDPIISSVPSDSPGVYISDIFYAYCQSFSRKPLQVTLTAPDKLYRMDDPANENYKIDYELIYLDSLKTEHSVAWNGSKTITVTEPAGVYTDARVVLSQPIMMRVQSTDVITDKTYAGDFKLEVSTIE